MSITTIYNYVINLYIPYYYKLMAIVAVFNILSVRNIEHLALLPQEGF